MKKKIPTEEVIEFTDAYDSAQQTELVEEPVQEPVQEFVPEFDTKNIYTKNIYTKEKLPQINMRFMNQIETKLIVDSPTIAKDSIQLRYVYFVPSLLCSIQFDPSGQTIAFSDGRNLHIISFDVGDILSSHEIPRAPHKNNPYTRVIKYSKDGKYIAVTSKVYDISIFSVSKQKFIGTLSSGHCNSISSLLFLNDSKTLLSGSYDGNLCIWDVTIMGLIRLIKHASANEGKMSLDGAIVSLSTDANETFIAVGFMNGWIGLYDPSFSQPMNKFKAHSEFLLSLKVIPRSGQIISASQDKTAKLWRVKGVAACEKIFVGHNDSIVSVAFPTLGKNTDLLLTGSKDEKIMGWSMKTGERLFTLKAHKNTIFDISHHPSLNLFATCSGDGLICVWDYDMSL
ncbi:Transcriptional repressor tup12-related protein [Histomonas meleagridis]|uniref:Transcriptional repressor tup12-related protein n=1 Tax=Histomonas meleagridis TaxID=135588 RepID=UPI00355A8BFF|nr:Transcriptional repressor tup12-related protein [Histomonas meleagridis]KAH0798064.1 Transcriptional repressor tup12-related protein [Histomonas meleagridis]